MPAAVQPHSEMALKLVVSGNLFTQSFQFMRRDKEGSTWAPEWQLGHVQFVRTLQEVICKEAWMRHVDGPGGVIQV